MDGITMSLLVWEELPPGGCLYCDIILSGRVNQMLLISMRYVKQVTESVTMKTRVVRLETVKNRDCLILM